MPRKEKTKMRPVFLKLNVVHAGEGESELLSRHYFHKPVCIEIKQDRHYPSIK